MPIERTRIRTSTTVRGITVLYPTGALDHNSGAALESAVTATGRLPCAVVDFSHVTFTDSTGINALLRANRCLQAAGGWLRLSSLLDHPLRTLEIVGVDQVIDIYPTLEAVLRT
ncbi:STAS domain-containing protein [Streptomyces microflavus]|uniref:STAS domain-containing protein n=1 Tax=Streptomyces microflavus TaxID=1919 RepID=UPI003B21C04D